nr:DUF4368 domain-containing protein [uncultured Oscillibacter sp.]
MGQPAAIQRWRDQVSGAGSFLSKARRYTDITGLTSELLRLFIRKIVVHEKARSGLTTRSRPWRSTIPALVMWGMSMAHSPGRKPQQTP